MFSSYFDRGKSAFHHAGVVFPPSIVTKTHSLDIFIAQNNTKAIFTIVFVWTGSKSLKASRIKTYLNPTNNGKWKFFFDDSLNTHGEN